MTDDIALTPSATVAPTVATAPSEPPSAPDGDGVTEVASPGAPTRQRWPLLGPTLCVFGAAMWAYVAMGELATTYVFFARGFLVGEGTAVLFVLATTGAVWWLTLRASLASAPARSIPRAIARGLGIALLAFLLWGFVTFVVTAFGQSSHKNLDGKITVCLLLVAAAATFGGRRLTGLDLDGKTPRERNVSRALWAGVALLTLVALVALVAD